MIESVQLGILCVNFDSSELIDANFDTFDTLHSRVYVADNKSTSLARSSIAALCRKRGFRLVSFARNLGFGAAMNHIAKLAIAEGCTHLLLQNPDASIGEAELITLLRFTTVHPDTIVSPTIENDLGEVWFESAHLDLETGVANHALWTESPSWLTAACLVLPVEVWQALGGFAESYFLYWEDVDLTFRWHQAGGGLAVLPVRATHSVGATQDSRSSGKSALYARFNARNRLLFAGQNLGFRDLLRWVIGARVYHAQLLARFGAGGKQAFNKYRLAAKIGVIEGAARALVARVYRYFQLYRNIVKIPSDAVSLPEIPLTAENVRSVNRRPKLFAFPYFADNPWQRMTYGALPDVNFDVIPVGGLPVLPDHARLLPGDILHLNWTGVISQNACSPSESQARVDDALSTIRDARMHGVRILWTVHNLMPHECPYPTEEQRLLRELNHLADSIMIMNPDTPSIVEEASYTISASKLWRLPHSSYLGVVPPPVEPFRARKLLGIAQENRILLCFGELRPYKRVDQIIEAFRAVPDEDVRLVIAGRPSGGFTVEDLENLSWGDPRIILRSERQNDDETAALFSAATLLVISHESGLNSGVAALAATYGCPVTVGIKPEMRALRGEAWVMEANLEDPTEASFELQKAIQWATFNRETLRDQALLWAANNSPATVADLFAEGLVQLSATGRVS